MPLLKHPFLWALPTLLGSLLMLAPATVYADLSMKPRTCSNCSGFGSKSPAFHYQPSPGISGHKSFGNHHYKPYRPHSYDSFKHSGKHGYRHQPDYRKQHHYDQSKHRDYRRGFNLGIVVPLVHSGSYYHDVTPRSYSTAPVTRSALPAPAPANRPLPEQNIDAWAALGDYHSALAMDGFSYQSQQNPHNALPKVGYALATAVNGEYEKAIWAMNLALAADVSQMHYFQADTNMQLVLAEVLLNYTDAPLMRSTILYLQQDYAAAEAEIDKALNQCQDCRAEQNLQQLISRKRS